MRSLAVAILLLASVLMAETQQEAYYRAMQAEEAGDIPAALKSFEEAVLLPGPYTEEIQEIIEQYKLALGESESSDDKTAGDESSLSFRFLGELGFYGLHYTENGWVNEVSENGGDLFLSLSSFADYTQGNYIHSLGLSVSGDRFLNNDDMPALDTCDWKVTLGLEYVLVAPFFLANVGVEFNKAGEKSLSPAFYGWLEPDFIKYEKQRFGAAVWGYYDSEGPLSFALYGAWHRASVYGWNGNVYLGVRFEADSVLDYERYLTDYENAYREADSSGAEGGYGNMEGDFPWGWGFPPGQENPFMPYPMGWPSFAAPVEIPSSDTAEVHVVVPIHKAYSRWIGPSLRSKISYKFRSQISIEGVLNLFYGFVLDGPDSNYEKIKKFNGIWGLNFYWTPSVVTVYAGIEQLYRWYDLPNYYKGVYARNGFLSELKVGVRWKF